MKSPVYKPLGKWPPRFIAGLDSASAMAKALGNFLHGKDFPGAGVAPAGEFLATALNQFGREQREKIFASGGFLDAVPAAALGRIRSEDMARWVTGLYPKRAYQAMAVGSATGAMIHFAAALGMPWLPQTFFIPVRRPEEFQVDYPQLTMEWARRPAEALLNRNADLQLHHMFDPNRDRLALQKTAHFRVKKLTLGAAYREFITSCLPRGGTLFVSECRKKWPTTKIGERHFFQFGGSGSLTADEFRHGGVRVSDLLRRYQSSYRRWNPPQADAERTEAEWGFEPVLREDLEHLARERGYRLRRVVFEEPEYLSPIVAELYRWWYRRRRLPANRLLVESYILMEPYWTLRTRSVPYWMKFNSEIDLRRLERYLTEHERFDEIYLMLFSHGTESAGLASVSRWRGVLRRALKKGMLVGVDEEKYPRDFGALFRYQSDLKKKIPSRYPVPPPLTIGEVDEFLSRVKDKYLLEMPARAS